MPQVLTVMEPEKNTGGPGQPGLADVIGISPTRRAVGRDELRLPRSPYRHGDRDQHGHQAAATRDRAADVEHMRRVGIEEEPPLEQSPGVIDRCSEEVEPRRAQAYLVAQGGGSP